MKDLQLLVNNAGSRKACETTTDNLEHACAPARPPARRLLTQLCYAVRACTVCQLLALADCIERIPGGTRGKTTVWKPDYGGPRPRHSRGHRARSWQVNFVGPFLLTELLVRHPSSAARPFHFIPCTL